MVTIARPPISEKVKGDVVVRFDVHQRIQHVALITSFVLLAMTGLPLKFNDWAISQWWIGLWGGINTTRNIHLFAAWLMVADCVYHLGYLGISTAILKRPLPVAMIPTPRDALDLFQEVKYYLGLGPERPRYGRFDWKAKFDYWAIFWGMPVMVLSGFIMTYPVFVTKFSPGWLVSIAYIAHSDEALLAVGWIFIFHFFFNHLSPGVFPLNKSIFTGNVPVERYAHEHPLEMENAGHDPGEEHTVDLSARDLR